MLRLEADVAMPARWQGRKGIIVGDVQPIRVFEGGLRFDICLDHGYLSVKDDW